MDALTLTIAIACVTSVGGAVLGYLFHLEREQADELAADNSRLREALQLRANEVTDLKSDVGRLSRQNKEKGESVIALSNEVNTFHKRGYIRNAYGTLQRYSDWLENGDKKPRPKRSEKQKIKEMGDYFLSEVEKIKNQKPKKAKVAKAVKAKTKTHQLKDWMQVLNTTKEQRKAIHDACTEYGIDVERLYVLNVFTHIFFDGSCVRGGNYADDEDTNVTFEEFMARIRGVWVEPVSQKEMEKLIDDVSTLNLTEVKSDRLVDAVGISSRPMTRAEACLAILHEAKEAGFAWAQSAIEQFNVTNANDSFVLNNASPLRDAVLLFNRWSLTTEGTRYWVDVADSKQVHSFKPKTKWPASKA